jgi:hypothetical protein
MTHTFSKSAFYSFGDIPLAGPLPLIFSQLQGGLGGFGNAPLMVVYSNYELMKSKQLISTDGCFRKDLIRK